MELSPRAREKLAQAGELSNAEKEEMKRAEELTAILADFFTQKLDNEALWTRLRQYRDAGSESVLGEIQLRLLHTLSLGSSDFDFERYMSAILTAETLKVPNRNAELEAGLKAIRELRNKYVKEKADAFEVMKKQIGAQVRKAAQQMSRQSRNQNLPVDIEGSVEASVRGSAQWRDFNMKYENSYGQQFSTMISRLVGLL
jgi:predicted outer membrane protein